MRPRLQRRHRALGRGKPLRELDLERGGVSRLRRDAGKDVARQQAHSQVVGVVQNDRVGGGQAERRGDRFRRGHRTPNLAVLHGKSSFYAEVVDGKE